MFPKYELISSMIYIVPQKHTKEYPSRFHKQIEIFYIKTGSLVVTIDNEDYNLKSGDIYVVFPNVIHSIKSVDNATGLLVLADNDLFPSFHEVLSRFRPSCPVLRQGEFPNLVYDMLNRANSIKKTAFSTNCNVLTSYISVVLGELINNMELVERSTDNNFVQQLIVYLLENYTREISLEEVAKELNYNKYYISHIISETFKCNFRTLVNSYRVSMAQNLLVSTGKSISEIAYECGFKNQSSFNRIFLKHSGVIPSEFRHNAKGVPEKPVMYVKNNIDNDSVQ
ncbi:MAG: helix-turn-helix domain-containing protein [Clostridia bacterium]|nr:helix-turn-helix domain-containing protein [Clostridia bacterium]